MAKRHHQPSREPEPQVVLTRKPSEHVTRYPADPVLMKGERRDDWQSWDTTKFRAFPWLRIAGRNHHPIIQDLPPLTTSGKPRHRSFAIARHRTKCLTVLCCYYFGDFLVHPDWEIVCTVGRRMLTDHARIPPPWRGLRS